MGNYHQVVPLEAYEKYVGAASIGRILEKSRQLRDLHVAHVNSTYYGGGVAELLSPLTLLLNNIGIRTGWRVIQGSPDFFSITKKMHNALQGEQINLSKLKMKIYEDVIYENALRSQDTALVNTLQRKAAVVLQKSLREGFGLTVTEAMWKGAAVVGG